MTNEDRNSAQPIAVERKNNESSIAGVSVMRGIQDKTPKQPKSAEILTYMIRADQESQALRLVVAPCLELQRSRTLRGARRMADSRNVVAPNSVRRWRLRESQRLIAASTLQTESRATPKLKPRANAPPRSQRKALAKSSTDIPAYELEPPQLAQHCILR